MTEQIDRDARLRARRARRGRRLGQDVERVRIDVDEHRRRADVVNRSGGREERERRRDDFVAAPAVQRAHRQQQRVGSVGAADRVLRVRKLGHRALQLLDRGPEDEQLRVDDIHHRRNDFIANRRVLRAEV